MTDKFYNLTAQNGIKIKIEKSQIESISPHIDGGSAIVLTYPQGTYRVRESVSEIMNNDG